MIQVKQLAEVGVGAWDAYVSANPDATFFHRGGWREVLEQGVGLRTHFLCAVDDGVIQGILPLAEVRSALFGSSIVSLPFCVYGGLVASSAAAASALDDAAQALAHTRRVGHLEYRNRERAHPEWPAKTLYVTFRKAIEADHDANMEAIPRKQRRMVRQGIKAELVSEIDSDNRRFFPTYAWNVHRLGTPVFGRRYFDALRRVFGGDCEVLTVSRHGQTVASVMSFYFRDEVLPYYGGGLATARQHAAYDFMYWEVMRRATEDGRRLFDFGRSKHGTGSFAFKKNWGFEPTPLRYGFRLRRGDAVPDVNPLNPKYRLFIAAWKRLPVPVANLIGPWIVRGLG